MIISQLQGGMGNQMFQYAAGRSLAYKLNSNFLIDLSWYRNIKEGETVRTYSLDCFAANIVTAQPWQLFLNQKLFGKRYVEKALTFDPELLNQKGSIYLTGYWQCEKYFKRIKDVVLSDFAFVAKPSLDTNEFLEKISSTNAISVHLRRGDYASSTKTQKFHGLLGEEYYVEAAKQIKRFVKNPIFYIFSDEPKWVKRNFLIDKRQVVIDGHDRAEWEDMFLMSKCRHHIIANSTYSWWGAWLSPNKTKKVITPKQWFNSGVKTDIIPDNWIRI